MKKLLVAVAATAAGLAVWRKIGSGKSEDELWAEATDKVA
jgi:hypothetical protein